MEYDGSILVLRVPLCLTAYQRWRLQGIRGTTQSRSRGRRRVIGRRVGAQVLMQQLHDGREDDGARGVLTADLCECERTNEGVDDATFDMRECKMELKTSGLSHCDSHGNGNMVLQ